MRNVKAGTQGAAVPLTAATLMGAMIVLTVAGTGVVRAADDEATARVKEMLHRTQEALRQAQSENAELQRAKTDAEQKLQAATKQIDEEQSGAKAAKAAKAALGAKLTSAESAQAETTRKLGAATEQLAATTAKLSETSKELAARKSELAETKQALVKSQTATASCETKNLTLYSYSAELLQRYKNKGVWASLAQKDPVFGLKEVDVENVVQEYQLKFDSQKIQSSDKKASP